MLGCCCALRGTQADGLHCVLGAITHLGLMPDELWVNDLFTTSRKLLPHMQPGQVRSGGGTCGGPQLRGRVKKRGSRAALRWATFYTWSAGVGPGVDLGAASAVHGLAVGTGV